MKETFIFFSVLIVLYFIGRFAINNRDKNTMANCNYSYAQITKKNKYGELGKGGMYGTGASLESVDFFYEIDGEKYYGRTSNLNNAENVEIGEKYLIIISKDDNEKRIVMFNYPIKDSSDFKRYVNEFEQKRMKNEDKNRKVFGN